MGDKLAFSPPLNFHPVQRTLVEVSFPLTNQESFHHFLVSPTKKFHPNVHRWQRWCFDRQGADHVRKRSNSTNMLLVSLSKKGEKLFLLLSRSRISSPASDGGNPKLFPEKLTLSFLASMSYFFRSKAFPIPPKTNQLLIPSDFLPQLSKNNQQRSTEDFEIPKSNVTPDRPNERAAREFDCWQLEETDRTQQRRSRKENTKTEALLRRRAPKDQSNL